VIPTAGWQPVSHPPGGHRQPRRGITWLAKTQSDDTVSAPTEVRDIVDRARTLCLALPECHYRSHQERIEGPAATRSSVLQAMLRRSAGTVPPSLGSDLWRSHRVPEAGITPPDAGTGPSRSRSAALSPTPKGALKMLAPSDREPRGWRSRSCRHRFDGEGAGAPHTAPRSRRILARGRLWPQSAATHLALPEYVNLGS
jgi:hypothetical protein